MARVTRGDVLAVHSAAGAVGEAIAQLAKIIHDVTLVAFVGSAARVAQAEEIGYDAAFVRGTTLVEDAPAWLDTRQVTTILDSQGTGWLDEDLELLAPGGQIILFGNAAGESIGSLPPAGALFARNAGKSIRRARRHWTAHASRSAGRSWPA